ncbi:unnamed protein product [Effrenium voratum]|nr:unnamed protein product [Effrenium voratum]
MGPSVSAEAVAWCSPATAQAAQAPRPRCVQPHARSGSSGSGLHFRALGVSLALAAAARPAKPRRSRLARRAEKKYRSTSLFADAANDEDPFPGMSSALDLLPKMEAEEDKTKQEPSEPAMVLKVKGDLLVVRAGKGLYTQDQPGTIACTDDADAVLLAWKEDIAILQLLAGEAEPGDEIRRVEKKFLTTRCSLELRGRILDPQGRALDGLPLPEQLEDKPVFVTSKPKEIRSNKYRALFTGVQGIDFDVPIGRGQTMLFQGSDPERDRQSLWPDLLSSKPVVGKERPFVNVCVCRDLDEAEALKKELEARGCWENCTLIVPISNDPASRMIAVNAAMALGEHFEEEDGEAVVLCDLEAHHDVWTELADLAGQERSARGLLMDPKEEKWIQMQGTVIRESIGERRKFWFRLTNRAINEVDKGSVTLLGWLWEQDGSLQYRKRQMYEQKFEKIERISRISDEIRQKLMDKVKADAAADGISFESELDESLLKPNPNIPGVPNWEIEELKSISDGHIILRPPADEVWEWRVDPYRSLPRLGTDALHPALISCDAPKLRLKMMQANDRANLLHDTIGAAQTLDDKPGVELRFIELLLHQRAGELFSIDEEVARIVVASDPDCARLREAEDDVRGREMLSSLAKEMLGSEAGAKALADIKDLGFITPSTLDLLVQEVATFR